MPANLTLAGAGAGRVIEAAMSSKLRVLCVTPTGPDGRGGIDRLFRYLRGAAGAAFREDLNIDYFAARGPDSGAAWILAFPWRIVLFTATLARWRPDIVHLNFATGGSLVRKLVLARIARGLFGIPVVIHFHGRFPLDGIARGTPTGRLFLSLCGIAEAVVALGEVSASRFREAAGVGAARIHIVPNGIPDFAPESVRREAGSSPLRIVFAGKVGDHKGVPLLIQALSLLPRHHAWTCDIAGDGEVERCEALSRGVGLSDRVRFLGWTEAEAIHRLMIGADVVVLPSVSENMPLSLIEGSCAGAALVSTPVGEVSDIVDHERNGFLVDRTPEAVAGALTRLLAEPALLAVMQAESRKRYEERFDLRSMAARLGAVYRTVARIPSGKGARGESPEPT